MEYILPNPVNNHKIEFQKIIPTMPHGPIAEFGVYEGGSTLQLAAFGRPVYAFDTFEGMPFDTPFNQEIDKENPPGKWKPTNLDILKKYPNIICVKGTFQKTLPVFNPAIKFAFVYLDCDWYSSYQFVVRWLAKDRLLPGAIALVDDFLVAGCRKAIHEMINEGLVAYDPHTLTMKWLGNENS